MAKQIIDIGSVPNDDTGDEDRIAWDKVNDNFTENYDDLDIIKAAGFAGSIADSPVISDCDNENQTSITRIDNSTLNTPGTNLGFLLTMFFSARGVQLLIDRASATMYFRVNNTGTWSVTWKTVTAT